MRKAPPGRPRESERLTREPLPLWDRVRFLLALGLAWLILVWAMVADNPLVGAGDAFATQVRMAYWIFILAGIELIRQIHFLISEHWRAYHRFWTGRVFGGFERLTRRRLSDWTRLRLGRLACWLVVLVFAAIITGKIIHAGPLVALARVPAIVWHTMPFVLQLVAGFVLLMGQFAALLWFLYRGGIDVYHPQDVQTRFSDVWGQDHVLGRIKENTLFLENPRLVEQHGGYLPGATLLWGPPGTGKSLMAEALAGETGKPYVFVDPGAFGGTFPGIGVLKVKALFRRLRRLALRSGGMVVFFDEAAWLGGSAAAAPAQRLTPAASTASCHGFSYLSADIQWRLANQSAGVPADGEDRDRRAALRALLTELSGLTKPRGFVNRYVRRMLGMRPKPPPRYRILVMMGSSMPRALDEVLLRPGRIDRIYKVGYPSKAGRARTYQGYLAKVRNDLTEEQIDKLATITPYATGATIKDLVNDALILAIKDGRDRITWPDIIAARARRELGPPGDVGYGEWDRHAVAVHEACHALVAYQTRQHMEIDLATIEKGASYLGMVASIPPEDHVTRWRTEYETDILVSLASLAGERMFFGGDSSSGVSGDLEQATTVASFMEGNWAMGGTLSSSPRASQLDVGPARLADRIEDNLSALLQRSTDILSEHRSDVLALAHALESHKTLSGEDVTAVFEHRAGPLIDGRPYGDPDFMAALDAYHEAAVRAHHDHGPASVPLPASPASAPPALPAPPPPYAQVAAARPNGSLPGDEITHLTTLLQRLLTHLKPRDDEEDDRERS